MTLADLGSTSPNFRRDHRDRSLPARLISPMLVATVLALAPHALAQTLMPLGGPPAASAQGFTAFSGGLIYSAASPASNMEPWVSDGTAAGTHQLADIVPGASGSVNVNTRYMVTSTAVLFPAFASSTGTELYRTDGTQSGTGLVLDIYPGPFGSGLQFLTVWNDIVYFSATSAAEGNELWRSDGTVAGTYLLLDIEPGPGHSGPRDLLATESGVYFSAQNATSGRELWVTDGTTGGTRMLTDIEPGSGNSTPVQMTESAGSIYFLANQNATGRELWKTDGTSLGTVQVADLVPGPGNGLVKILGEAGGHLLFYALTPQGGDEIDATDGVSVSLIKAGVAGIEPTKANDRIFFIGSEPTAGHELWVTDGTTAGTHLVVDLAPGGTSSPLSTPFVALNGRVLFGLLDPSHHTVDTELWISDGTQAGTHAFSASAPVYLQGYSLSGDEWPARRIGDRVYFSRLLSQGVSETWYVEDAPGRDFCFGDGSQPGLLPCPCGNVGAPEHGCANSLLASRGARLEGDGQHRPDEVVLSASGMLPDVLSMFLQGSSTIQGSVVFGDGLRCIGGSILRLAARTSSASGVASYPEAGEASLTERSAQLGDTIPLGATRVYQTWYRDPAATFCPSGTSNVTQALSILW